MTDQYLPTNVNAPRGSKSFVAVVPPMSIQLNLDDDLVIIDTSTGPGGFTLPEATQIPGLQITVKATNAGSTGNSVFLSPIFPQTIDGALLVILTADEESITVKSDGSNWRVVGSTGAGATSTSISLDLTFDDGAAASVPPVLFTTWAEIMTAVSLIPGNAFASPPYVTKYRLNLADGSPDPGTHDLNNAEFRAAKSVGPDGLGYDVSAAVSIENVASLEGIRGFGNPFFGNPFSWPLLDFEDPFVEVKNCEFRQLLNGGAGPSWLNFPDGGELTLRGRVNFGVGSLSCDSGALIVNCYERTAIEPSALSGFGDIVLNIFSPDTEISFSHFVGGFFDINIGGAQYDADTFFTLGETILFSSGGPIVWTAGLEQEIYAGGTNPAGATPPEVAFALPRRGMYLPKFAYMRGIGVVSPTTTFPSLSYDINVYDGAGFNILSETFSTGSQTQFSDFTFGRALPFAGGLLRVTITPLVTDVGPVLPDGIVVGIRSA